MTDTKRSPHIKILDITKDEQFEKYLYKCLAPMPFRKYNRRQEYLRNSIPKGFRKKLLILDEDVVGQIEYAPSEASGYPIMGNNVIVMNCVWVLRKAKRHNFGRLLLEDMVKSERDAVGFATIALEGHPSPWFKKVQIEKLGFRPIDSIKATHKIKYKGQTLTTYLMWMPTSEKAKPPTWDKLKLLEGETFCLAHPLYRPQKWEGSLLEARL